MGYIKTFVFALAALLSLGAMAETKIAVCDVLMAISAADKAKKRFNELVAESNLGKMQAEADGKIADGQAMQKDHDDNNLNWDEQRKARYKRDMEGIRADIELIGRKMQAERQALQATVFQELQPIALEQLDILIKEEKIEILLKKEAVLWNVGAVDITNKLIDRINKVSATDK